MSLIEMIDVGVKTERPQQPDAAEAEDKFLLESVILAVAIEMVGQFAILGVVLLKIRIEQKDRDLVPVRAGVDVEPGSYPDWPWRDRQRHHRAKRQAEFLGIPPVRLLDLAVVGVNDLAETPCVAHERDKDDGNFKIGARSHRVPGQHAKAAGIGMHLRPDGDLHGEVGDVSSFEKAVEPAGHCDFFQAGAAGFR